MPEWLYITIIAVLAVAWFITLQCWRAAKKGWGDGSLDVDHLESCLELEERNYREADRRANSLDLVIHELVELNPAIGEAFPRNPASFSPADWMNPRRAQPLTRALDADKVLWYREARLRTEALTRDCDEVDAIREKFGVLND